LNAKHLQLLTGNTITDTNYPPVVIDAIEVKKVPSFHSYILFIQMRCAIVDMPGITAILVLKKNNLERDEHLEAFGGIVW